MSGDVFVANRDGTFTCEECFTPELRARLGDDDVEVWEVGSHGWTAPVVCAACRTSIPVVVDGETTDAERALALVREAYRFLKRGKSPRAAARVRGVLHSVEGAARHAALRSRAESEARARAGSWSWISCR